MGKGFYRMSSLKLSLFHLRPIVFCPIVVCCEDPDFISVTLLRVLGDCWCSQSHLFSRLNMPGSLSLFSQGRCSGHQPGWGPSAEIASCIFLHLWIKVMVFWMWFDELWRERASSLLSVCWLCFRSHSRESCWPSLLPRHTAGLCSACYTPKLFPPGCFSARPQPVVCISFLSAGWDIALVEFQEILAGSF